MAHMTRKARKIWHWTGTGLFVVGAAGAFVPLMPTTVFWIGAVACYTKSSPRLARRILRTPVAGPAILGYFRWARTQQDRLKPRHLRRVRRCPMRDLVPPPERTIAP